MIVAVPVTSTGGVTHGWGRAAVVGVAEVRGGEIVSWVEHEVRWDLSHDAGPEGEHHARVVRFLREHGVTHVIAHRMGPGMTHTLGRLGVTVTHPLDPDARQAVHLLAQSS